MRSGEGAELTVTWPTVEVDPITTYYRVTTERTTEVYEDGSEDEFGDGSWWYASWDEPTNVLHVDC